MTQEKYNDEKVVRTDNLYLACALIAAGYSLTSLEGLLPRKAVFVFRKTEGIERTIDAFWQDTLRLPVRSVLQQQKALKDRLYEQTRLKGGGGYEGV